MSYLVCPLCGMSLALVGVCWPWHYPALPAPGACLTSTLPAGGATKGERTDG